MKNRIGIAIAYVVLGVLLILIPTKLFSVCGTSEMKMACYYTQRTVIGIGFVVAVLGAVTILFKNAAIRFGISIAQLGFAALVFLYPLKLIGLCKMSTMHCQVGTKPALIIAGIILIVLSVGNAAYLYIKELRVVSKTGKEVGNEKELENVY